MIMRPAADLAGSVAKRAGRAHLFGDGFADERTFIRQLVQKLCQFGFDLERHDFFLLTLLRHNHPRRESPAGREAYPILSAYRLPGFIASRDCFPLAQKGPFRCSWRQGREGFGIEVPPRKRGNGIHCRLHSLRKSAPKTIANATTPIIPIESAYMTPLSRGPSFMRFASRALLIVGWLVVTSRVGAQSALPPRWHDLPKLAASWPPAWAALVGEVAPPRDDFEKDVLHRVGVLLRAEEPSKETYRLAEIVLAATLRHHQSVRRTAPLADNPSQQLHAELEERLANVRKDWLNHLQKTGDGAEALRLAEQWLPATANDIPLRASLISLWANQAKTALEKADYTAARTWLNRLETQFGDVAPIVSIGKVLQDRAQSLL